MNNLIMKKSWLMNNNTNCKPKLIYDIQNYRFLISGFAVRAQFDTLEVNFIHFIAYLQR